MALDSSALAALRSNLPWWGGFGLAPLLVLAAFASSLLATLLGLRLAGGGLLALPADAPWYARARAAHPTRVTAMLGTVVPAAGLGTLLWLQRGPLFADHAGWWLAALGVAGYLGAALARRMLGPWIHGRRASLRRLLAEDALAVLALMPHLLVLGATAACVRAPADAADALALGLGGLAMLAVTRLGAMPLLRSLGWVREAPARVRHLAERVSERTGVRPRSVELVTWEHANAFAMPLAGRLFVTSGACEVLDDEGLEAILAHEQGHLREGRGARMLRRLGGLVLLPVAALPLLLEAWGLRGALGLLAFLLGALALLKPLARRLEQRADAAAHADERAPGVYARALERLYRANRMPAVLHRRHPHPDLYDRMLAAGVTPDYERPAPPSRGRELAGIAPILATVIVAVLLAGIAPWLAVACGPAAADGASVARAHVIATSGRGSVLALAMALDRQGQADAALATAGAGAALHPDDASTRAYHAHLLARAGRCEEAGSAARTAERLAAGADDWTRAHWEETRLVWPATCPVARAAPVPLR